MGTLGIRALFLRIALYLLAMPFLGIVEQLLSDNTRGRLTTPGAGWRLPPLSRDGLASACREQSLVQLRVTAEETQRHAM